MIRKVIFLMIFFIPILLYSFDMTQHYEKMFNTYRRASINYQIRFLSGKTYPEITNAIMRNVYYKLDTNIISIIWQESKFKTKAKSPKYKWGNYYDHGLMMVSDYFWEFDMSRIYEPDYNIRIGYKIYMTMLAKSNYNLWYSFKYYNGSAKYANTVINIYHRLKINCEERMC